jgi:hypothetical protein
MVGESLEASVDRSEHAVATEIELALVDQERVVYVLLYDISALVFGSPANQVLDVPYVLDDVDTLTTVCVLARLDNPGLLRRLELSSDLFELGFLVGFIPRAFIVPRGLGSFAFFAFIEVLFNGFFPFLLLGSYQLLEVVVVSRKLLEVRVADPKAGVEGQREDLEGVLA